LSATIQQRNVPRRFTGLTFVPFSAQRTFQRRSFFASDSLNCRSHLPTILNGLRMRLFGQWIVPREISPDQLTEFTEPYPAEEIVARPISTLVNNLRNDSPDCIVPIDGTFHEAGPL
jgi:hypothetical protein